MGTSKPKLGQNRPRVNARKSLLFLKKKKQKDF
jgi:hypothetical protein